MRERSVVMRSGRGCSAQHTERPRRHTGRRGARLLLLGATLALCRDRAAAQSPAFLVRDINAQFAPQSSDPSAFVARGDVVLFAATTPGAGAELWRRAERGSGSGMVKDILPGPEGSNPSSLTLVGDAWYFAAAAADGSVGLWRSDGSEAGTRLVRDLGSGTSASEFVALGDRLFFVTTRAGRSQLWRSDGTRAGTAPLREFLYPPSALTEIDATLYFRVDGYGHFGQALWQSDGTVAGTVQIKAFNSGFDISIARVSSPLLEIGDRILLLAGQSGAMELWGSDGSEAGTSIVHTFNPSGATLPHLTAFDGQGFFLAAAPGGGTGLWRTDGTESGTAFVTAIPSRWDTPSQLVAAGSLLFFDAVDAAHGVELWRSDGTAAGTTLVRDLNAGERDGVPQKLTDVAGTLFFSADDGAHGVELWRSDGSAAGTVLVQDIAAGARSSTPSALTVVNDQLYFSADDGSHGREPWRSGGDIPGAQPLDDLAADDEVTAGSAPIDLFDLNGALLLRADDGRHGGELWRSDGTSDGTVLLADINPGPPGSTTTTLERLFGVFDGSLYFWAADDAHGVELWKTDGSAEGTTLLLDIAAGPADSYPYVLGEFDGTIFLAANDAVHGSELWTSGADGTALVRDLNPGPEGSYPHDLVEVNGVLLFGSVLPRQGSQLWRTDGSEAGTVPLKTFAGFYPLSYLSAIDDRVVFLADDGISGAEVWTSDGTAAGTTLLADIAPGRRSSFPAEFTPMHGALFFQAAGSLWRTDGTADGTIAIAYVGDGDDDYCRSPFALTVVGDVLYFRSCIGTFGTDLWRSDGTAAGTVRLKQISTGPAIDRSQAILGDLLIFPGSDAAHGVELWRSDGTPQGTGVLRDIAAHTESAYPGFLKTVGDRVVFQACVLGVCRPWVTDGREAGTRQLADVASSGPFETAGPLLFFPAADRLHGDELWAVPLNDVGPCTTCTANPTPSATPSATGTPTGGVGGGSGCAVVESDRSPAWIAFAVLLTALLMRHRRRQ